MPPVSEIVSVISTFLVPVLALSVPGLALISKNDTPWANIAKVILWSVGLNILSSLVLSAVGLPVQLVLPVMTIAAIIILYLRRKKIPNHTLPIATTAFGTFFILYLLFALPFLSFHNGLPTGDSQKAIFWANRIVERQSLPDYSVSRELLNRDPVDFFTPGLHTFTASVTSWSAHPLTTVGFLAIALAIAVSLVGAGLANTLIPKSHWLPVLTIALTLTQFRFLRYLREPGYHFQNIAGELLLFGLLLIGLRLINKFNKSDALLAFVLLLALPLTHQFSAFLAAFVLAPILITLILKHRYKLQQHKTITGIIITIVLVGAFAGQIPQRLAHFFTLDPHLLPLTPSLLDYLSLMGFVFVIIGLIGLALMWSISRPFFFSTTIILIASQGPRLGIDIPPVRTLFFAAVPLAICSALTFITLFKRVQPRSQPAIAIALILLFALPPFFNIQNAFALSHAPRTNATLTPELQNLIAEQTGQPGAILIDSYNHQSTTWLLQTNRPTFVRLASDLSRQMEESNQNETRRQLYLKHLDYEKILSLGSLPDITALLDKHSITTIAAINKTSATSLQHNPLLQETGHTDTVITYEPGLTDVETNTWLLNASTLANDIGDNEDTFEHLQASIRASRLSPPQTDGDTTFRTTTAPQLPLVFNVGDYVAALWSPDQTRQLYIRYANGIEEVRKLSPRESQIDSKGFITVIIENPDEKPISLDVIALGISPIP